jgi:hypothetical protein
MAANFRQKPGRRFKISRGKRPVGLATESLVSIRAGSAVPPCNVVLVDANIGEIRVIAEDQSDGESAEPALAARH